MGACDFMVTAKGKNASDAFQCAVADALYDYGHRGYTGTIAEKHSFVVINVPSGKDPREYACGLIDKGDDRIDDN